MEQQYHYYATLVAGIMAGLPINDARELAYYCYGTSQQFTDTAHTVFWQFNEYSFKPIITRKGQSALQYGVNNCALAFETFPAMQATPKSRRTESSKVTGCKSASTNLMTHTPLQNTQFTQTHCFYNPLTDVDWQGGGDLKQHFKQRLAHRATQRMQTSKAQENVQTQPEEMDLLDSVETSQSIDSLSLLRPVENSKFIHKAINDVIYKQRYHDLVRSAPLALLGCRLFVLQQSWSAPHTTQSLLNAWISTWLAIYSFKHNRPMPHTEPWATFSAQAGYCQFFIKLEQSLAKLQEKRHGEIGWLELAAEACLHQQQSFDLEKTPEVLFYGLALRPAYLLEQAQYLAGSDEAFVIHNLSAFKQSLFYKLNQAAHYHCDWLARQLASQGLNAFNTQQSMGNLALWRET